MYSLNFMATHFTAHRKAFAFHSSTPVSGVFGKFDNNSVKKDWAARWQEMQMFFCHDDQILDFI